MASMASEFLYCLTRPGSEPLLKQEVSEFHPTLRFAFSRPGIVTFKSPKPFASAADVPFLRFARRRGITLARGTVEELYAFFREHPELHGSVLQISSRSAPEWLEAGSKDAEAPPVSSAYSEYVSEAETLGKLLGTSGTESGGKWIIEFIQTDPGKWILGESMVGELEFASPAGLSGVVLPESAPSRAYLKLEEALVHYSVRVEPEDEALDLGCAPGGMSYAWLQRGARVTGVDRGEVAPSVAGSSRFRWIESNLAMVPLNRVPQRLDWVSLDVHAQPMVSIREALPLIEGKAIQGFFMNLKINRPGIVKDLPLFERELAERLKLVRYCTKQLPSNRDEVAFFGVTQTGLKRCQFPAPTSPVMGPAIRARRS